MGGSLQERCNDAGPLVMNYEYKILRYLTRSAQLIAALIRHFRSRIRFTIGRVSLRILVCAQHLNGHHSRSLRNVGTVGRLMNFQVCQDGVHDCTWL